MWNRKRRPAAPTVLPPADFLVDAVGGKVVLAIRWGDARDVTITQAPEQACDLVVLLAQAIGAARQQATELANGQSDRTVGA